MKTNTLGKVKMTSSARPRARFDLSHNVNTTFGFGETQPLSCRLLVPGTKSICSNESLIRLAPMVSPTFGLMKMKTWHYFVGMSDLSRNFAALMAQTKVSRYGATFMPTSVPYMKLGALSAMILQGSHCSVWESNAPSDEAGDSQGFLNYDTHLNVNATNRITASMLSKQWITANVTGYDSHVGLGMSFSAVCPFLDGSDTGVPFGSVGTIYLQNRTWVSLFERTNDNDMVINVDSDGLDDSLVYLDSADYVVVRNSGDYSYAFAFRLSSFGKRLRKILQGLGYQINFADTTEVSLMPLFAYYKAYFDTFGLTLYSNWDTTNCAKLLEIYDTTNATAFGSWLDSGENNFSTLMGFFKDLASCWTTSEQDFVSAHTRSIGISSPLPNLGSFLDVSGSENPTIGEPPITQNATTAIATDANLHAFINRVQHSQLDSELLKRLYKWTNRNTIAGQRIEALLRAQGLGDYVDSCKPRFIGYTEVDVDISDVVAQSDTFNEATNSGSQLGQYGGRGIGYDSKASSKTFEYENDEFGYWITFAAIVPLAGYTQMLDGSLKCIEKLDFYNPEFDGLGYEATTKNMIVGNRNFIGQSDDKLETVTFGYVPKYSSLKVANNVMNGDFNLRSTRSVYLPFTIDKVIDVGERYVRNLGVNTQTGIIGCTVRKIFKPSDLPNAGPHPWRFDTRYAWLGNYNRIFSYKGDNINEEASRVGLVEYYGNIPENFMCHNTYHFTMFAPMLPINESFETNEDGNDGKSNMSVSKS